MQTSPGNGGTLMLSIWCSIIENAEAHTWLHVLHGVVIEVGLIGIHGVLVG